MEKRLTHIDNAKAIGMALIIASHVIPSEAVGHTALYGCWNGILNSFYVPLFFILAGIFEPSDFDKTKLIKRILKLVRYCLTFYIFGVLLIGVLWGNWCFTNYKSISTIWFLFVLLWLTIIVGATKIIKYKYLIYSILTGGGVFYCLTMVKVGAI